MTPAAAAAAEARCALEQTILLGALDDATLDALAAAATVTRYRRGDPVVVAGEPGGDLLVVAAGRLKVVSRSVDGIDVVLAVAGEGDTLGELSVLDGAPRSATVEAADAAVVVRVSGAAVRRTIRAHPDLAEEIIVQQAAMIRRASGMVSDLVFLDVPRRVAKYVIERTEHRPSADLGMSQSELAAAVGGVRQTVNAALRGLERRGWIRMEGRTVTVHDRAALEDYATAGAR
jgi:CRP/FNR family transcriptional regulator, cyclic AMP receptor protein